MKNIVCDFDDTLSFTTDRDWDNAKPNKTLIAKLNALFDNGYNITILTARGNLSCKSRSEADKKYRAQIEKWLAKNNVKYNNLSFDKLLADYYIDDKGITPNDFVKLKIEKLEGGLSGAYIERRGGLVFKTQDFAIETAKWYDKAEKLINNIKVHSVIGSVLSIPFIEKTGEPTAFMIDEVLSIFENASPIYDVDFSFYIDRINEHLNIYKPKYSEFVLNELKKIEGFMNENKSFGHGDFSIDNMIVNNNNLYLIDPILRQDLYSSYLLDVAKLKVSCKRFNENDLYNYYDKKYKNFNMKILEISHWVRMRKYSKDKFLIDNNIKELLK